LDEYAATKAAADLALGALAQRGLACVRFRPFNHIGPGQQSSFVVANFARQIARIEAGLQLPVIKTGNLQPTRDFLDVRDVARAYALALGKTFRSGTILNIASGQPVRIGELLSRMIEISGVSVRVETDVSLARSHELASVTGDASRARDLLGWTPQHRIEQTLAEVLAYWRSIVSSETDGRRAD
jgi:GDP-4-dehydro-6-deoxy-D-mannose reductase